MRQTVLLLLVILSGCYSIGPIVTEIHPAGLSPEGRPRVEIRRCMLAWGTFKQLQIEDCSATSMEIDSPVRPEKVRR